MSETIKDIVARELKELNRPITEEDVKKAYNRVYCRRYRAKNKKKVNEYNRLYQRENRAKIKKNKEKKYKSIANQFNNHNDRG